MTNNITLINFNDLDMKDKKMILSWRNHPSVKQWMYFSEDITLENHLKFIETLKSRNDKLYFLVKRYNKYIGVIDFTNITECTSEFGLYANINVKGVGKLLLNSICEYGFAVLKLKRLVAEVFDTNKKALYLYKKFKFNETGKKVVNNKKVICMELKNENR